MTRAFLYSVYKNSIINKHQNPQWLQCYSMSCVQLLNFALNTAIGAISVCVTHPTLHPYLPRYTRYVQFKQQDSIEYFNQSHV